MRAIAVVAFLLLAGCSSPTNSESVEYGFLTANEALPYAVAAANASMPSAVLAFVAGTDVDNVNTANAPADILALRPMADGRASNWQFIFTGANESISVMVMAIEANETPKLQVDSWPTSPEPLSSWQVDSDEAAMRAAEGGMNASADYVNMELVENDGPVWVVTSFVANKATDFRLIDANSGELLESLNNSTIELPQKMPEGGSDRITATGSATPSSISFEVTIESSQLVFNYTRTGTDLYATASATFTDPNGNVTSRGHNPAQLNPAFNFIVDDPSPGTYHFNVTGAAGHPAFDIQWCALGYDPNTGTDMWCPTS